MLAAHTETPLQIDPASSQGSCSIHVCRTWNELVEFHESWNHILRTNPASSIFQTREWLAAWWQAFAKEKPLLSLVFADPEGNTVGIAPFYVEQNSFFGRKLKVLRMVGAGSGDSDALDFITLPGFAESCAEAFASWFAKESDCDVGALETFPDNSLVAKHLAARAQASGWNMDTTLTANFIVDLPESWPQYIRSLDSSFRPLLTRYPRRLQSRYAVRIVRCERVEDLKQHLDTLFSLHQMRWAGRGEPGAFANEKRRDFYFNMAVAFLQRQWLEFWLLELDGEIVGAQFCFCYHNTVSLLQEGFHPKYAAEKIGYALRAHVLEEMIRTGAKRYDFLGGADPYKAKFGARQENYLNVFFAGPSRLGRAYVSLQRSKRRIKNWLKRTLPASLLAKLRRIRTPYMPNASM